MNLPTDQPAEIAEWQNRFERVLEACLPGDDEAPARLHRAMRYSALDGGKRFRPVLVYAAGRALEAPVTMLDTAACAIELIHAYSLIHDDLPAMDDDDLRRGRPSCHRQFDEATAILAGDALQALAYEILAQDASIGAERALRLLQLVASACGSKGMAGGQALDLDAVGRPLSLAELETMHRLKTGALIHASVMAPCLLVGADESVSQGLSRYGHCIGLAFQIHDDILDVTGDTAVIGKASHSDEAQNKPTFPSLLGLDESRRRASRLRDEARDALHGLSGDTTVLNWLADYVISRDR